MPHKSSLVTLAAAIIIAGMSYIKTLWAGTKAALASEPGKVTTPRTGD